MTMTDKPGPGKFEGNASLTISEYLYSLDADEFFGFVDDASGWFGIIRYAHTGYTGYVPIQDHYIVHEDNNGFFTYFGYDDIQEVNDAWNLVVENNQREYGVTMGKSIGKR